jgi:hypothetical protein
MKIRVSSESVQARAKPPGISVCEHSVKWYNDVGDSQVFHATSRHFVLEISKLRPRHEKRAVSLSPIPYPQRVLVGYGYKAEKSDTPSSLRRRLKIR